MSEAERQAADVIHFADLIAGSCAHLSARVSAGSDRPGGRTCRTYENPQVMSDIAQAVLRYRPYIH